jgi:hypothetical protein
MVARQVLNDAEQKAQQIIAQKKIHFESQIEVAANECLSPGSRKQALEAFIRVSLNILKTLV